MVDREGPIHRAIVAYLRAVLPPECVVAHVANEGVRGGARGRQDGVKRKAMGQVAGFPDLIVLPFANVGPLFFEVKAEGGRIEKSQREFHKRLGVLGYRVAVVRSVEDAREALREWGIGTREATATEGQVG